MGGSTTRIIIMGAAGRDFHNFNVCWRDDPSVEVVCFTATQIPNIDGRVYPSVLAGPRYPNGIPIHPEEQLEELIREHRADVVTFAYSDVSYEYVMREAARVNAAGAEFRLLGARQTMLPSSKPVIAVCAVRTGCGKSQTARRVTEILKAMNLRVAVVRHPMPYGDLSRQVCQRFETYRDLDEHKCTIEEREEYEPHLAMGNLVYAGVDYAEILRRAEAEADVVLWDGGNNDLSFYRPDLLIVVADPHRPGHERRYYPGEINLRLADVVVINKVDTAQPDDIATVEANARAVNPSAVILKAASPVAVKDPDAIAGKRVLVIEDGPTLTHGEMPYGAGLIAARDLKAAEVVDPRPYACGSIKGVFEKFGHLKQVLPAMGYGDAQIAELQETVNAVPCDAVLVATPIDLSRLMKIDKPFMRVRYELQEHNRTVLPSLIQRVLTESRDRATPGRALTADAGR